MYILMLGCFDTKAEEFSYLYSSITANGEKVITINTGVMKRNELFPVNFDSEEVAAEGGVSLDVLRKKGDRGYAVDVMSKGAAKIIRKLISDNLIKGAIGMGGGAGTFITLSAMQEIPLGIPKFCLSTLAGRDVTRLIGNKDITLMPSIVDIAGLNRISKPLISQAAAAICAMANARNDQENSSKGSIAVSMFGNTTQCVNKCIELLKKRGYEVFAFHANGVGGKTMESLIREGCFDAVLDITTTELADDLCEGICSAGPTRLSAASEMGIPQVVVPGCLDMVNFGHPDTIPDRFKAREFYSWAPDVTLMRTNKEENKILGERLAQRLNLSKAPVSVLLPKKGISQIDSEGGIFFGPETNRILFETINENVSDKIKVAELNLHINDEEFAEELVKVLLNIIEGDQSSKLN
ncbi:MAG TPA: Tm-1-like ATP-binding domain-containing protein [Chitinophagaceae bacterium]|nr:Tm-1-like ATP-binding domain-containing protein [Chitinophagaceae bacterium]